MSPRRAWVAVYLHRQGMLEMMLFWWRMRHQRAAHVRPQDAPHVARLFQTAHAPFDGTVHARSRTGPHAALSSHQPSEATILDGDKPLRMVCVALLEAEGLDAVVVLRRVLRVDAVGERLEQAEQSRVRAHVGGRVG